MDPVSAAGLALSVAGVGFQIYTGCIQGKQPFISNPYYEAIYAY